MFGIRCRLIYTDDNDEIEVEIVINDQNAAIRVDLSSYINKRPIPLNISIKKVDEEMHHDMRTCKKCHLRCNSRNSNSKRNRRIEV